MVYFIISQNFIMRITMWQIASWVIEGEKRKRYTQLIHYQLNYDSVEKMETEGKFPFTKKYCKVNWITKGNYTGHTHRARSSDLMAILGGGHKSRRDMLGLN